MTAPGRFIVLCGIDGSGKTTQERLLAARLRRQNRRVTCTRNPTDWYRNDDAVRQFLDHGRLTVRLETLALIAAADRMRQLDAEITPLLQQGVDVICNRYVYSTYGYFKMRGADMAFVESINSRVRPPDKAVLLTIDPKVALNRIRRRGQGLKHEERSAEYLHGVQEELNRRWPDTFPKITGDQRIEVIANAIHRYVEA